MAAVFVISYDVSAQVETNDSLSSNNNAIEVENDSIIAPTDSVIVKDSLRLSPQAIESTITYSARDSIIFLAQEKIIKLYGDVVIEYEDIVLTAAYIEIDFDLKNLWAEGVTDSTGNLIGTPVFKEKDKEFEATTLKYNFDTKKGYLTNIFTEESDAYLHGTEVKKLPDDVILIKNGSFTTCPDHDPHFEVRFTKAKVIPDEKIITGPVWLVVEDVPLPLGLPFGFFPNKKGQQNGILLPTYGESANRGFYLENGGYYFGIKDFADLSIKGDVYSRGSWGAKIASNYKLKYKFDGFLNLNYAVNKLGEPGEEDYSVQKDFFIVWKHNQDPKAHPRHRFNADVKAGSSEYSKFNPSTAMDYLSSNFSSSITYTTTFGSNVNFSVNLRHSQNKQTKTVDMSLPEMTLSTNRIYPFRKKVTTGKLKIWENINLSYVMNAKNTISSPDSLLFKDWQFRDFSNGVKHQLPLSLSQKVLKYFNLTSTFTYTERWYLQSIDKYWDVASDTLMIDTIEGFKANRDFSFSTQLQTKLYGMYLFKKGPVAALRHMITPSVSFTYRPDFGAPKWGYYHYYKDPDQLLPTAYTIFQYGNFGFSPYGEAGIVQFSISNNLEMKIRTPKDSINPVKKVMLIENFTASISHDIAKDSLNWSKLSLNGRTKLFKNLELRYILLLDPYITDTLGVNLNQSEWKVNHRLFRATKSEWGTSLNWSLNKSTFEKKNKGIQPQESVPKPVTTASGLQIPGVNYNIPWNLNLSYTMQYTRMYGDYVDPEQKYDFIQTLSFNGEFSPTPGWKFGFMSGYDFINHEFVYTSVNIYRDLHCWEIIFNWIPAGFRKSYNFTLRVKAPMLQDLKINKRTDWRDYY